jgi:epoxyqueuosine reductase
MSGDGAAWDPVVGRAALADRAAALGFEHCGVAAVPVALRRAYFAQWIERGHHGGMQWLARDIDRRLNPEQVVPGAQSVIVCGMNYHQAEPARRGRIAKYALGRDYHRILLKKLKQICDWLRDHGGINRPYVDTGPLLEKPLAAAAGMGWIGKNTVLLNAQHGQWLLLGCIVTTLELAADTPQRDRCGSCTRCLDVCPTRAFPAPYQLDARRCIAYLTIEHHGPIAEEFRPLIGDHLFGCDDCLDVCPWNKWAQATREARFAPRAYPDLVTMLEWDEPTFLAATEGTPIRRLGVSRWRRNICVVLGNTGTAHDLPALQRAATDADALVAEHAAWAVARIAARQTFNTLPGFSSGHR